MTQSTKKQKVVLLSCMAGPSGVAQPGTVLDLPATDAKILLDSNSARPFERERDSQAKQGLIRYRRDDD